MHFYPRSSSTASGPAVSSSSSANVAAAAMTAGMKQDFFAIGLSDGTFRYVVPLHPQSTHRVEGAKVAHQGAVTAIRWNHDGSALCTGGEDGAVKIFSRNGQLRTTVIPPSISAITNAAGNANPNSNASNNNMNNNSVAGSTTIYAVAWSRDNDTIAFARGKDIVLKPLQASQKGIQWKAHDGCVLCMDWSSVNSKLVSGGEDGRYKVWDAYGRLLYSLSQPLMSQTPVPMAITSVSWSPDASMFAVGGFNTLLLCDSAGWTHSRESTIGMNSGSVYALSWAPDGATLAAAGATGQIVFGKIVHRVLEYKDWVLTQRTASTVTVSIRHHISEEGQAQVDRRAFDVEEELAFRDPVLRMVAGYDHVVIMTTSQLFLYDLSVLAGSDNPFQWERASESRANPWTAPHVIDLNAAVLPPSMLLCGPKGVLLVDSPQSNASPASGNAPVGLTYVSWVGKVAALSIPRGSGGPSSMGSSSASSTATGGVSSSMSSMTGMGGMSGTSGNVNSSAAAAATGNLATNGMGWNSTQLNVSETIVSCLDRSESRCIRFYEIQSSTNHSSVPPSIFPGSLGSIRHHMDIVELASDRSGQYVAFIDRNRDLYIATTCAMPVSSTCASMLADAKGTSVVAGALFASSVQAPIKLATMVDGMKWHEDFPMLSCLSDGALVVFPYPSIVFDDRDLLIKTKVARAAPELGKFATLQSFTASSAMKTLGQPSNGLVHARRTDGALIGMWLPSVSFFAILHGFFNTYVSSQRGAGFDWQSAVRLCRFARDPALWATLGGIAVHFGELISAETAYAALGIADRVQYMIHMKDVPTAEGRLAEMAVFRRAADEAEHILLQSGLIYRAIKMHIRLFHWDRALEIAQSKRVHVETVLAHRQRYLESLTKLQRMQLQRQGKLDDAQQNQGGQGEVELDENGEPLPSSNKNGESPTSMAMAGEVRETLPRFLAAMNGVTINWENVERLVQEDKEREAQRPGARPYGA
jgi:WD40 repeat protein